jgi:hypothetical protein
MEDQQDNKTKEWRDPALCAQGAISKLFTKNPPSSIEKATNFYISKEDYENLASTYPISTFSPETKNEIIQLIAWERDMAVNVTKGEYEEQRKKELEEIRSIIKKKEIVNGFQPYGYSDEETEKEIYFQGFEDGRAMMMIDLLGFLDRDSIIKSKINPPTHV